MIKMLALMDLASGMILQLSMMCLSTHEMSQLAGPHQALLAGDVLLGDRAFCSFGHLQLLGKMAVDAVFRMHQLQIVDFTPGRRHQPRSKRKYRRGIPRSRYIKKLGNEDQIVEWKKSPNRPLWMSVQQWAEAPAVLVVRELRYQIVCKCMRTRQVTLVTTLLDPMRFPKREIARLYKLRWEIETNFRHLKSTMKMEHLKCKSPDAVMKELMMFALVYNLVRGAMLAAAQRQEVEDANRISFIDALRWVQSQVPPSSTPEPILIINPTREGRSHPRIQKRRKKPFDLMNKPRAHYAQPSEEQFVTA